MLQIENGQFLWPCVKVARFCHSSFWQEAENATIPELIRLSLPDGHILLMAFTAGAAAALGQVLQGAGRREGG